MSSTICDPLNQPKPKHETKTGVYKLAHKSDPYMNSNYLGHFFLSKERAFINIVCSFI